QPVSLGSSEEHQAQGADSGEHVTGTGEGSGDVSPRATSAEEPEAGNPLVRIWRGAGTGNRSAYSTTAFSRCLAGRALPSAPAGGPAAHGACGAPSAPRQPHWRGPQPGGARCSATVAGAAQASQDGGG